MNKSTEDTTGSRVQAEHDIGDADAHDIGHEDVDDCRAAPQVERGKREVVEHGETDADQFDALTVRVASLQVLVGRLEVERIHERVDDEQRVHVSNHHCRDVRQHFEAIKVRLA